MNNIRGRGRSSTKTSSSTDHPKNMTIGRDGYDAERYQYLNPNKLVGMESIKTLLKNSFLSLTAIKDDDDRSYRDREINLEREIKLLHTMHIEFYMSHKTNYWLVKLGTPTLRARRICVLNPMYMGLLVSKSLTPMDRRKSRPSYLLHALRKDYRKNTTNLIHYQHPHISSGSPCLGQYSGRLNQFAHEGAIGAWFLTMQQWMNTWNRGDCYWNINHRLTTMSLYPPIWVPKARGDGTKAVSILSIIPFGDYLDAERKWRNSYPDENPDPSREAMFLAAINYYIKLLQKKPSKHMSFLEIVEMFAYANQQLQQRTSYFSRRYKRLWENFDELRSQLIPQSLFHMDGLRFPNEGFTNYLTDLLSNSTNSAQDNLNPDLVPVVKQLKELNTFSNFAADYAWKLKECWNINFMAMLSIVDIKKLWVNEKKIRTAPDYIVKAARDSNDEIINSLTEEGWVNYAIYGNSRKGIMPHRSFISATSPFHYIANRIGWLGKKIPPKEVHRVIKDSNKLNARNPFHGRAINGKESIALITRIRELTVRCVLIIYADYLKNQKEEAQDAIRAYISVDNTVQDEQKDTVLLKSFLEDRMVGTSMVQSQTQ